MQAIRRYHEMCLEKIGVSDEQKLVRKNRVFDRASSCHLPVVQRKLSARMLNMPGLNVKRSCKKIFSGFYNQVVTNGRGEPRSEYNRQDRQEPRRIIVTENPGAPRSFNRPFRWCSTARLVSDFYEQAVAIGTDSASIGARLRTLAVPSRAHMLVVNSLGAHCRG